MHNNDSYIDDLIKEVAIKHQIGLSKDDPIMILPTINRLLLQESELNQQAILKNFKEELQKVLLSVDANSRNNAKLMINNSTDLYIEQVRVTIEDTLGQSLVNFKKEIRNEYTNARHQAILATISAFVAIACVFVMIFI